MADIQREAFGTIQQVYRDQEDGTHALVETSRLVVRSNAR